MDRGAVHALTKSWLELLRAKGLAGVSAFLLMLFTCSAHALHLEGASFYKRAIANGPTIDLPNGGSVPIDDYSVTFSGLLAAEYPASRYSPGDSFRTVWTQPSGAGLTDVTQVAQDAGNGIGCFQTILYGCVSSNLIVADTMFVADQSRAPGKWRFDFYTNGVLAATRDFFIVPYKLYIYGGSGQTIPFNSSTPIPLSVAMRTPDNREAAYKPVVFKVTSKPGGASAAALTAYPAYTASGSAELQVGTDASGIARVYLSSGTKAGTYTVTATSKLAPPTVITFTVSAANIDPLAQIDPEKNLGSNPADNSTCASATDAQTANPVNIATGNKLRVENDYLGTGAFPLALTRYYNSLSPRPGTFGNNWRGYYDRAVTVTSTTAKGKTTTVAAALRHDGRVIKFKLTNGVWVGDPDVIDRMENLPASGYRLVCGNDQVEDYASNGKLIGVATRDGFAQILAYDAQGRLSQVTDAFGRKLTFGYDASNRVATMVDPAGKNYAYTYAANGNLAAVQYPDLKQRQYHYENGSFPAALTGITDENQVRYATFSYDAAGRATQSVLAGGAQLASLSYNSNGTRDVTDATGVSRRYGFAVIQGVARRTSVDDGACASCITSGASITSTAYSASGFVTGVTDYRGTQTAFVRDQRGLETSRTEAVGTTEQRSVTTTWHASWRVPFSIGRAGRTTAFTYDSTGRMLTRTEADTATNAARRWAYTYNGQGLLATIDGPRTDVSDVTTYTYDALGNLSSVRNALGHITRFTSHDAHGRLLSMTDPNGLVTTFAYDLRGRLLSRNEGGLVTSFTYTASGQPLRTTRPDGSWVESQYDAAQRVVGLLDSAGQRIAYTLDGNGRRTAEEHFDSLGTSVFLRSWSYDTMGRVIREIDAQGTIRWQHGYDPNGNLTVSMDAHGQRTLRSYDTLDRPRTFTDATSATTSYTYDARDNLVRVVDPRGVVTQYTYDGLDNLTQESSPDAGLSSFTYDAAGNLKTRTWANAKAVSFTLDALNRVSLEDYGSGVFVSYSYDTGVNGIGRPAASADGTGSNTWSYDLWGRIVSSQRSTGPRTLTTTYGYDGVGRLAAMGYPSGRTLTYAFDTAGRISGIAVDGQSLVNSIAWQPFGAMKGWTQSNGRTVLRSFDRDGQLRSHSFDTGARSLTYDTKGRVAQIAEPWGNRNFGYDAADRLVAESTWAGDWTYVWDGNGNRLSQTSPGGTTTYSYQAGSNRIVSASGLDARVFSHDAAGNMTAEGGYSFTYDARNRLAGEGGTTYAYDAMGRRIFKSSGMVNRYHAHDEQRKIIGEYDDAGALGETVWLGSTPVAFLRGGQTYWIDADHLDTPRAVRNASDQIVWRWRSDAFGNQAAEDDPAGLGPFEFNHRLPGQWFDRETALHHNDQRDYRAHTGRYVQSDPIGLQGGINTYAYVGGNPLSFTDPMGLATAIVDRSTNTITVTKNDGTIITYPAGNNTTNPSGNSNVVGSNGPAPAGIWPVQPPINTTGRIEYGDYFWPIGAVGPNGQRLDIARQRGIGLHCGRRSHLSPTQGCVRMDNPDCSNLYNQTSGSGDPITVIEIR